MEVYDDNYTFETNGKIDKLKYYSLDEQIELFEEINKNEN